MKQNIILFLLVAVLGASAGGLYSWYREQQAVPRDFKQELLGQQRPAFTLGASDGSMVSARDFDGRVVLINFWATWCEPCREEMPMLTRLHNELGESGLSIVGIALDDVQSAREFAADLRVNYTILVGGADVMATGVIYGNKTGSLPYTVLIDREGIVQWTHLGVLNERDLRSLISPLL